MIYSVMAKTGYPKDTYIIVHIYQGHNVYNVGIDKTIYTKMDDIEHIYKYQVLRLYLNT